MESCGNAKYPPGERGRRGTRIKGGLFNILSVTSWDGEHKRERREKKNKKYSAAAVTPVEEKGAIRLTRLGYYFCFYILRIYSCR